MPHLSWTEVRERAIRFSRTWTDATSERADKQTFWNEFFDVFGLRRASLASFEANVRNLKGHTSAIDLLWKGKLLVEHKSFGEDLSIAKTQAFTYIEDLTRENRWDELPRFVLVSDFARFVLYDLEPEEQRDLPLFEGRKIEPHHFTLAEFPRHIRAFAFMLGQTRVRLDPEDPANQKAYDRMCELHDALRAGGFAGHDLERLLVRILFCLFAEDTLIFQPDAFTQFIRTQTREDGSDCGAKLNELCDWLNNPAADGALADTDPFYGFRYVNGGLFAERLGFPRFTREMRQALLDCCDFQWARISPAVFGSLFQGVMEDRARRQQGAHYTSERDIMKVLRSLFLDELRAEWEHAKTDRSTRQRAVLEGFHQKLRSLQFLDPACGCGNFLVLAYRELRTLEIDVVRELNVGRYGEEKHAIQSFRTAEFADLIGVNVDQFHGIEYSEWPVRIAEVALWLMDHQMNAQASEVFGLPIDRLPLK
ncbi:MAG: type IIL restriction-modification enzyme MmeI, partial [Terrimicrobiaceae bacterium]